MFFATTTSDSYQLFTKFPVTKLEDLKGKKIIGAGAVGQWIEGLGATFVNSGIPQMYNAVQTGVGEGVVLIPSGAVPIKLHEVAPYVTYVNFGAVPFGGFAANKAKWDSLPQEVRDVIEPLAKQYSAETVRIVKERRGQGPRGDEGGRRQDLDAAGRRAQALGRRDAEPRAALDRRPGEEGRQGRQGRGQGLHGRDESRRRQAAARLGRGTLTTIPSPRSSRGEG